MNVHVLHLNKGIASSQVWGMQMPNIYTAHHLHFVDAHSRCANSTI
jgi:hypothetical protein